jgi:hypothetical protein
MFCIINIVVFCIPYLYFFFQNANITSSDGKRDSDFIPTYAVIDKKPPPSPSSIRNGRVGGGTGTPKKFVTLSGDHTPQGSTVSYQERGNVVQYQPHVTHSPTQEGSNFKYSSFNGGQSPYEYQQQQQQHYQQQHRIAQQQYAFPINSSQPTPYSTLSSRQLQSSSAIQVYPGFRPRYDEDYDNPGESTPIMNHQQRSTQWTTNSSLADDTPEPTPLVHPSAKRPMTFDQVSSSKMSIYDNVQFGLNKLDEED